LRFDGVAAVVKGADVPVVGVAAGVVNAAAEAPVEVLVLALRG
jgi:hypothetical protein